jgi:ribonuclease HI
MSDSEVATINIDGASRGNPGPAAYAYVISRPGHPVVENAECLPATTNNSAEYTALVRALERAAELGAERLLIKSDSELLVKQMNGQYRVKHPDLRPLYEQACALRREFRQVTIVHVPRAENRRADELCNLALDGDRKSARQAPPADHHSRSVGGSRDPKTMTSREASAHEEALACLRSAASAWSLGDPDVPAPKQVLEQILSVLEENGILKARKR